jgi:hypothetical protein
MAWLFAPKLSKEGPMNFYYRISPWLVPPLVVPALLLLLIAATRMVQ